MADSNTFSDIENHLSDSLEIINQLEEAQKVQQDLTNIVDKLTMEIESLKISEQSLMQQLKSVYCSPETLDSINSLYVKLKEQYNDLQNKFDALQEKYLFEKAELEQKFAWEKNELLQQIKALEHSVAKQKTEFLSKESELLNDLQLIQASTALQYDEMESHLKSMLKDATQKLNDTTQRLQDSNSSCNILREELLTIKNRSNCNLEQANKCINNLERKLQLAEQQLQITQEQLFTTKRNDNSELYPNNEESVELNQAQNRFANVQSSEPQNKPSNSIVRNRIVKYNNLQYSANKTGGIKPNVGSISAKYDPLSVSTAAASKNVSQDAYAFEEFQATSEYRVKPPGSTQNVHLATGTSKRTAQGSSKMSVPPLRQLTAQNQMPRKRKLFNPSCLEYLNDMDQPN